ncbi:hypothetical protein [Arthrobacter sp. zg-Y877]|uniref:hypothetical protein n=1 Tax=Arthrobacter sp. zg-Y877 TaxID=3049074 RepID=UPI0025A38C96|nr:hypothetical protein [Arthrobacter sp. zg-Y877]MDM7989084.1 hypothetical protein [Arthrobacter sp. zg-Y877]
MTHKRLERVDRQGAGTAGLILAGVLLCALPALMFGMTLGHYPSRMVCTPETGYGSGCDEGGMEITLIVFAVVALSWAGFSLSLTKGFRQGGSWVRRWWPFLVFSLFTALFVVVGVVSALSEPDAYF